MSNSFQVYKFKLFFLVLLFQTPFSDYIVRLYSVGLRNLPVILIDSHFVWLNCSKRLSLQSHQLQQWVDQ